MYHLRSMIWLGLGHFFCGLGIVGIFLPGLPTTPFLLLAAFFYSKGSERFHVWLTTHPRLGPPIERWQRHGVISRKAKALAVLLIVLNLSIPLYFWPIAMIPRILAAVVGISVMVFIVTRPSEAPTQSENTPI